MLQFTGLKLPMPSFGPWQWSMLSFSTIISLTRTPDYHSMTCSLKLIGLTANSMTFMFGVALYMCWIKQFKMVRRFHVGIPDQNVAFTWVSPNNMQAAYLWLFNCQLAPSHHSFMLFLMIGLPPLLPVLMISLTSPDPTGQCSLVNPTISTLLMRMMLTKWSWKRTHPLLPGLTSKLLPIRKPSLMPSTPFHQHHYKLVCHLPFNLFNRGSHQPPAASTDVTRARNNVPSLMPLRESTREPEPQPTAM